MLVSDFGSNLSISTTSTEELETAEVEAFTNNRLLSRLTDSLSLCFLHIFSEAGANTFILEVSIIYCQCQ